jgi:DNA-binding transcriptional regulator YdaS (Cro superfamily)
LRDWLDSGGRKITWLADAIPVNRSHLHQWLNGRHMPREVYRRRIEEITDGAVLPEDWE